MLTEKGRVVALDGDSVWVETLRQSTCGSCSARSGCGHGMLNAARAGASRAIVKALVSRDRLSSIALHDTVELELPERSFLAAASWLYAVPVLTTVGASVLADQFLLNHGHSQGVADLQAGIAAALGLAAGLAVVRWQASRVADNPAFQPRVTARV